MTRCHRVAPEQPATRPRVSIVADRLQSIWDTTAADRRAPRSSLIRSQARIQPSSRQVPKFSTLPHSIWQLSEITQIRYRHFLHVGHENPIIGAMAELESSLISERVTAGMKAAEARGRRLDRPPVAARTVSEIEALAASSELGTREMQKMIARKVSAAWSQKLPSASGQACHPRYDHFLHIS